jgi:hypothetical protein
LQIDPLDAKLNTLMANAMNLTAMVPCLGKIQAPESFSMIALRQDTMKAWP